MMGTMPPVGTGRVHLVTDSLPPPPVVARYAAPEDADMMQDSSDMPEWSFAPGSPPASTNWTFEPMSP